MKNDTEITLLSEEEIWGKRSGKQLEVLQKYGIASAITDLAILTGGRFRSWGDDRVSDDQSLKGRPACFYTKSSLCGNVCAVFTDYKMYDFFRSRRDGVIRPVLRSRSIFDQVYPYRKSGYNGTEIVTYGEYPQYVPDYFVQRILESEYSKDNLKKTGRSYTFDQSEIDSYTEKIDPITYDEYSFADRKYIRVKSNFGTTTSVKFMLSNGCEYADREYVWIEVSPVEWLIDEKTHSLISKRALVSGIIFVTSDVYYDGNFSNTEMKNYLDKYMLNDLMQYKSLISNDDKVSIITKTKRENPYNLRFEKVSEEEIMRGCVESDMPVFLHGRSSEGKSARVKALDSDATILYLRNATPESLNGKSVYNANTGEMIDVEPTWYKKLAHKCESEPDKLHILFFDELTNALPSIQGMAFNIILDKEVNGIWKLPENARIVAAGNDMEDSLAANQMAEPLFNRFAHVYIETTPESFLKWASEHNIHPAICSYIAYGRGETLRTSYNGVKPNADPRKWEMASKMLYATGNPKMLRSLVGEEITEEFIEFCNQNVIKIEDVLGGSYTQEYIECLNSAEKYSTVVEISKVGEEHFEKAREFANKLGEEFRKLFDFLWANGDEKRLEKVAEANFKDMKSKEKIYYYQ